MIPVLILHHAAGMCAGGLTTAAVRACEGDGKCPGSVALRLFRGSASPEMPRGYARETKYGTEWLEGDE